MSGVELARAVGLVVVQALAFAVVVASLVRVAWSSFGGGVAFGVTAVVALGAAWVGSVLGARVFDIYLRWKGRC